MEFLELQSVIYAIISFIESFCLRLSSEKVNLIFLNYMSFLLPKTN